MTKMTFLTLLVGVATAGVVAASQSESTFVDSQPMESVENRVGERRVDAPEVVLQLKYDRGELNKIYLTQFRKNKDTWQPSVPARTNLCADLCHAGLGGSACGSKCGEMVPVGLQSVLRSPSNVSTFGEPRYAVCPTLCANKLGEPLCDCNEEVSEEDHAIDWTDVCASFCKVDKYTVAGCPPCDESGQQINGISPRILHTEAGWAAWCGLQCGQGHGGAACNCDRSPLQ